MSNVNVYIYWDKGYDNMPDMLKYIYNYNVKIAEKFNFNIILLDDTNINNYIDLHIRFSRLAPNFKSDIIRWYILDKYGGIWLDTDIIIIKNLNILWDNLLKSNKDMICDIEFDKKIGCCSLIMKKNTKCSNFCYNYVNNVLDSNNNLNWNDIGPNTITKLYLKYPYNIILNDYDKVKNSINFICWNDKPGIYKNKWIMNNNDAIIKALNILNDKNCYYVITWTIYKENNIPNVTNYVFNNSESVFSYLVKNNIYVDNINDEWNGYYLEYDVKYKDINSISYIKDISHNLYKYNNSWRLGKSGEKVFKIVNFLNGELKIE
jgi:hypothetical protein